MHLLPSVCTAEMLTYFVVNVKETNVSLCPNGPKTAFGWTVLQTSFVIDFKVSLLISKISNLEVITLVFKLFLAVWLPCKDRQSLHWLSRVTENQFLIVYIKYYSVK